MEFPSKTTHASCVTLHSKEIYWFTLQYVFHVAEYVVGTAHYPQLRYTYLPHEKLRFFQSFHSAVAFESVLPSSCSDYFFLSANQCSVKLRTQRTPLTQFWSVLVSFYSYFRGQGLRNCVLKYPWMHASKRVTRGGVHGTEKGKPEGETFVTGEVMEILLFLNLCLNAVWSSFHIILHLHF